MNGESMYRKLYLKIRLFLYSIREILNTLAVMAMIATFCYLFINNYIFEKVIVGKANYEKTRQNYSKAITFYNIAYFYYGMNHFSEGNKEIYIEIPYQIAICYLDENNKTEAVENMFKGMTNIQKQYGMFSPETARFTRKYLIDFYILNDSYTLAYREFNNLLAIYKIIGYSDNEIADMIRLKGDLAYQQKNYDAAMDFYKQASQALSLQRRVEYDVIAKIVDRACDYNVENGKIDDAIERYKKTIVFLKNSGKKQDELTAQMLIRLGDLYSQNDKETKNAITCYENAIKLIEKLPGVTYSKQNIKTYLTTLKDLYNRDGQFHKVDEVEVELARKRRFSFL